MDTRAVHRENGAAWDFAAEKYAAEVEQDIAFLRGGGTNLLPPEERILGDLSAWCGRAIHLQCSHGLDALSLWNMGAKEVIGVDISERMLDAARQKTMALNAPATWYRCDVLETPHSLDGTADLVYTGKGALPWMMDLAAWAEVPARLLKPGGRLYVFEGHPLDWVWYEEASEIRLNPQGRGYFQTEPAADRTFPREVVERVAPEGAPRPKLHERQWTLGDVINALLAVGLRVERFEEHPEPFWNQFENIPAAELARLPHTYSLLMRKSD